jgi:hypothetical protein
MQEGKGFLIPASTCSNPVRNSRIATGGLVLAILLEAPALFRGGNGIGAGGSRQACPGAKTH